MSGVGRVKILGSDYNPLDCTYPSNANYCAGYTANKNDYWAGAYKACKDLGLKFPSASQILQVYNAIQSNSSLISAGICNNCKYWASGLAGSYGSRVTMSDGNSYRDSRSSAYSYGYPMHAICFE